MGEGEPGKWMRRGARAGREGLASARAEREERRVVIEEACFGIFWVVVRVGFGDFADRRR